MVKTGETRSNCVKPLLFGQPGNFQKPARRASPTVMILKTIYDCAVFLFAHHSETLYRHKQIKTLTQNWWRTRCLTSVIQPKQLLVRLIFELRQFIAKNADAKVFLIQSFFIKSLNMLKRFVMVLGSFWTLVSFVHMQNHNWYRTKELNQATALTALEKKAILKIKNFLLT